MNPEQWKKIKSILEEALEIAPEKRAAFLDVACDGDTALRREVVLLLDFDNGEADLLENSAFSAVTDDKFADNSNFIIGEKIGNYEIIDKLGSGGMGAVFLAKRADGAFEHKVALKLIKRGMDSEAVLHRFLNERQILASLEHPNIARLIDGGTTADGLPYFVMEYVEGETITEYAERENLEIEERLNLFREVCVAVSFAHQNLVIHRDLKPSNILITKNNEPKLLDFGIAKLLKSDVGEQTATQMHIFTPEYASPEQVRGEKLTTATDVYSLGVIIYELLTGCRPYKTDSKNIGAIIKAVCETEPLRPSAAVSITGKLSDVSAKATDENQKSDTSQSTKNSKSKAPNSKFLRGDLDNIILKALRKEPERRYSSVEQLSEDIRRHQMGLPVTAIRDTWNYRASKFLQRNSLAAGAAALVILTLLGGLAATLYQARIAKTERAKAEQRFDDVRQLANSFLFEFHDAIETLPGATPARELVVKRAVEYLDKLAQSSDDPQLQRELAAAYDKIARIQGNSYFSNLGDSEGGMKNAQRAFEIRESLAAADPNNRELQRELAESLRSVGDMLYTVDDLSKTRDTYERALKILDALVAAEPENRRFRFDLAEINSRLADVTGLEGFPNLGDTLGALELYRRAAAINEELVKEEPENKSYQLNLARRYSNLGMLQNTVGESASALETGLKSIALQEKVVADDPNNTDKKVNLLSSLITLRFPLIDEGRTTEGIANARRVIKNLEELKAVDPKNAFYRRSLGVSYNSLGICLREAGDIINAIESHRQALSIAESLVAESNAEAAADISITRLFLAESLLSGGNYAEALKNLRQTQTEYEKKLETNSANKKTKDDLATVYAGIAEALNATGDSQGALDYNRRSLKLAEEVGTISPFNAKFQTRLGQRYFETGKTLTKLATTAPEKCGEAQQMFEQSTAVWQKLKERNALHGAQLKNFSTLDQEVSRCDNLLAKK